MSKFASFMRAPCRDKWLMVQVFCLNGYHRYLVLHRPFRAIAGRLGESGAETSMRDDSRDVEAARPIERALRRVSPHTPWESNCLAQAFTAAYLLRRRLVPYTVYLGVRKGEGGQMQAHAWTRVGPVFVTGGEGQGYTVTARFAKDGR